MPRIDLSHLGKDIDESFVAWECGSDVKVYSVINGGVVATIRTTPEGDYQWRSYLKWGKKYHYLDHVFLAIASSNERWDGIDYRRRRLLRNLKKQ